MRETPKPELKSALRAEALARRAGLGDAVRADAAQKAAAHFLAHVPLTGTEIVSGYWPIRDEIDPGPILDALAAAGHRVCLPVTHGRDMPLSFRQWVPGAELSPAGFGTLAPGPDAPDLTPDIAILPLAAFDRTGNRVGYGAGHYDRTIAGLSPHPLCVGLAFAVQEVDRVPAEAHDIRMDMIITEMGARLVTGASA